MVSNGSLDAQAEVSYEYMRSTTDEGGYLSPSRVVINKRRIRTLAVGHGSLPPDQAQRCGQHTSSGLEPQCSCGFCYWELLTNLFCRALELPPASCNTIHSKTTGCCRMTTCGRPLRTSSVSPLTAWRQERRAAPH